MPVLSVSIPCYNEQERLPEGLSAYIEYLEKNVPDYEIVLVDDGSTDDTLKVIETFAAANPKVKFTHSSENRGRGFGMRTGVLACSGEYILETDADLPVSPEHIMEFMGFLEKNPHCDFVIGCREHPESRFLKKQPTRRVLAGKIFHILFAALFRSRFKDVMCGFKMFRNDAAKVIFKNVYDEKYLAAAEIIFVANKLGYTAQALPVDWKDDRRSKVKMTKDTLGTLLGLFQMKMRDWRGRYKR